MPPAPATPPSGGALSPATRQLLPAFLGITIMGSWPLWLGLAVLRPPEVVVGLAVTLTGFAPAVAAWAVSRLLSRSSDMAGETGLKVRTPGTAWPLWWLGAWVGMPLLVLGALGLSAQAGTFPLDLRELSGARAGLAALAEGSPERAAGLTPDSFLRWQLGRAALLGPFLFAPAAFGHEWGWRGWLLPRLLPLGLPRALALSGALWGAWLAPLVLAGHSYAGAPAALGVLALLVTCTLLGALLGVLRLGARSVWPAVVAHASLAAFSGVALMGSGGVMPLLVPQGVQWSPAAAGLTGWPGWVLLAGTFGTLAVLGVLPHVARTAAAPPPR
jgi:hypothetical protein